MDNGERLYFLDNLRTFLIFLVVFYHAGLVYEASGFAASFWVVDDPSTSNLPGLLNLVLDIFIMPTIFFISGFFSPSSLERKGPWRFLQSKFRRLIIPWAIAVFTLIPLYEVVFLYSRGLPQESWTTYFHFSNGIFSMNWLWFLPALFLFDCLYVCAVTTFKYFFNRQGRLGRELGRLSYNVYIIHIAVMGPIALALLKIDIPAILKYPILTLMTFAASNLIAYAYANTKIRLPAKGFPDQPLSP